MHQAALGGAGHSPTEAARRMAEAEAAAAEAEQAAVEVPRPEAYNHISEVSPVPDEIWRRAKARSDNML